MSSTLCPLNYHRAGSAEKRLHASGSAEARRRSHPCSSLGPLFLILAVPLLLVALFLLLILLGLLGLLFLVFTLRHLSSLPLALLGAGVSPASGYTLFGGQLPGHISAEVSPQGPVSRKGQLHQVTSGISCRVLALYRPG